MEVHKPIINQESRLENWNMQFIVLKLASNLNNASKDKIVSFISIFEYSYHEGPHP